MFAKIKLFSTYTLRQRRVRFARTAGLPHVYPVSFKRLPCVCFMGDARIMRVHSLVTARLLCVYCAPTAYFLRGRSVFAWFCFVFFARILCIRCEFNVCVVRVRSAATARLLLVFCVFAVRLLRVRSVATARKPFVFRVFTACSSRGACEFAAHFLHVQCLFCGSTVC